MWKILLIISCFLFEFGKYCGQGYKRYSLLRGKLTSHLIVVLGKTDAKNLELQVEVYRIIDNQTITSCVEWAFPRYKHAYLIPFYLLYSTL